VYRIEGATAGSVDAGPLTAVATIGDGAIVGTPV
jgi:hypothetical protein